MRIKAKRMDGKLFFDHFVVKKCSVFMYGVYHRGIGYSYCGDVITSATSRKAATKKARLLEIGYRACVSDLT